MFGLGKTKIKLPEYPGLVFIPYHQLKKDNGGFDFYKKTIKVNNKEFTFFKFKSEVFAVKPSSSNKDETKELCVKVENPVTRKVANNSITGNCARGVTEEFREYVANLINSNLKDEEIFRILVKGS